VRIVGLNSAQKAVGVQTLPVPPKKAHDGP
jgi:hypothetical protein